MKAGAAVAMTAQPGPRLVCYVENRLVLWETGSAHVLAADCPHVGNILVIHEGGHPAAGERGLGWFCRAGFVN
jgi:hypothetical protein